MKRSNAPDSMATLNPTESDDSHTVGDTVGILSGGTSTADAVTARDFADCGWHTVNCQAQDCEAR